MKNAYGPDGSHGSQCYAVPGAESGHFLPNKTWLRLKPQWNSPSSVPLKDGQILDIYADPREGGVSLRRGPFWPWGDTRQMYVVAEVYETDIGLGEGWPICKRLPAATEAFNQAAHRHRWKGGRLVLANRQK